MKWLINKRGTAITEFALVASVFVIAAASVSTALYASSGCLFGYDDRYGHVLPVCQAIAEPGSPADGGIAVAPYQNSLLILATTTSPGLAWHDTSASTVETVPDPEDPAQTVFVFPVLNGFDYLDGRNNAAAVLGSVIPADLPAAAFCDNLTSGHQTDWYLPSPSEIDLIRRTSQSHAGFGVLPADRVWSSMESLRTPEKHAAATNLSSASANIQELDKDEAYPVICVRRSAMKAK